MDPVSILLGVGSKVIDKLWPDETQRDLAKLELLKMQQSGELSQLTADTALATAQINVNAEDAKSGSVFVSGARPFILWGCGFAMIYAAMLEPMMRFLAVVVFGYLGSFPVLDTTLTTQVLLGLLGLAGMRSVDKIKGVASK
ncbi:Holin of 3TMs, for gene-transfer release [uncultured Caudovirales phage]|uniref:Holin of 3TMs, for gene-transfer release n=1 Tax=uncultured Caudovirales phage TaxID=2100421 RepID=A0A6J5S0E1_9CAUD|nr:Holin of 3TMs, for gene-transfer release [uncultured Caudovirales phage]